MSSKIEVSVSGQKNLPRLKECIKLMHSDDGNEAVDCLIYLSALLVSDVHQIFPKNRYHSFSLEISSYDIHTKSMIQTPHQKYLSHIYWYEY
jgi:hypothetical protein